MSQEELAFKAELTPTYVSQIEGGKRNPSLDALFRLCTALQTDLGELFKA
jgi:transcriptional regulator with XRE-family HTH domain